MSWLATGGAGYIGSHVVRALRAAGHDVVVLDDLSTGVRARVPDDVGFVAGGLHDPDLADRLREHRVHGIVHLAAKKSAPESVARPLYYYEQNVTGTTALLAAARAAGVDRVLYSSTAAVYGETGDEPVTEDAPTLPVNPYGRTKLAAEWAVRSLAETGALRWCALRYFNVVGASEELLADRGSSNLLPLVQAALASGEPVSVFGDDYPTPDGTCVRDYVHVADLADAHVAAVAALEDPDGGSPGVLNVGRHRGVSVLEMIEAVGRAAGRPVPVRRAPRRAGDPARVVADAGRIARRLGWSARRGLDAMVSPPA